VSVRAAALLFAAAIGCAPPAAARRDQPSPVARAAPGAPLDREGRIRQVVDRFTFGARPEDIADVQRMGIDGWLDRQLHPERIADRVADSVLALLDITTKTAFELNADHPQGNEYGFAPGRAPDTAAIRRKAMEDGMASTDSAAMSAALAQAARRQDELALLGPRRTAAARELAPSLLIRAVASERQLLEVMTVFWENHFSVSAEKMPNPFTLVDYDRAIRSHALGKFRDLLQAVATSPAMLVYLDNYQSRVDSLHPTHTEWLVEERRRAHPPLGDTSLAVAVKRRRTGLNENYARELMELHTLGVDGGYSQQDVQEVARCLTGWGVADFQTGGTFFFDAAQHDAGDKTVLGVHIPGGRGIEDGEQVLDILARHPSTARFVARKLVGHFVSDSAPAALVERVAQTYLRTDGDVREMLRTIVESPEFNGRAAYRAKVKTPFELVASIARVMRATPDTSQRTAALVASLGQPIFGRATPDGWPDQGVEWMNAGALMNRVNLGVRVGANQFPNVVVARWAAARAFAPSSGGVVASVIGGLLSGDVSSGTREALLGVAPPAASATPQQWLGYVGQVVGVALGSPEFQHR
jgi:uncharacterized protein (DUF1800 family)